MQTSHEFLEHPTIIVKDIRIVKAGSVPALTCTYIHTYIHTYMYIIYIYIYIHILWISYLRLYKKLWFNISLGEATAIREFSKCSDVFVVFPTSNGKSLDFATIPLVFDYLRAHTAYFSDCHYSKPA